MTMEQKYNSIELWPKTHIADDAWCTRWSYLTYAEFNSAIYSTPYGVNVNNNPYLKCVTECQFAYEQ